MARRYYIPGICGSTASITGADALHLTKALRAKPGETLVICDGNNLDYPAEIVSISKEEVQLALGAPSQSIYEPSVFSALYIGFSKGEKMEYSLQKCVELGAGEIIPFFSENCVVKPKNIQEKTQRLNRIALEAAKQCGRGILPVVRPAISFGQVLQEAGKNAPALFLYEQGGIPLRCAISQETKRVSIITGPEGGFSPKEHKQALDAGFCCVNLGPRILRCETAPVAVLACVMAFTGNLE